MKEKNKDENGSRLKKAAVVLNGKPESKIFLQNRLNEEDYDEIIAADGGAKILRDIEVSPDVVIGDMDSLSREAISELKDKGCKISSFPPEKDETDAELSLQYCSRQEIESVDILSALGGRVDQQIANIFLLELAEKLDLKAVILDGGLEIGLVGQKTVFEDCEGARLSLLPLDKIVGRIKIEGCKYNASEIELKRYRTRGLSNLITSELALVKNQKGSLVYVIDKKHGNLNSD